jgi:hypothetical protein
VENAQRRDLSTNFRKLGTVSSKLLVVFINDCHDHNLTLVGGRADVTLGWVVRM